MHRQLSFELPARPALGRNDFYVSEANALALALIDADETWPDGKLTLTGPAGSGKTHLAHVWAARSGAAIIAATNLSQSNIPALAAGAVVVEDVPQLARDPAGQEALFHLHNLLRSQRHKLLLTGRGPVARWGLSLPDLTSRMQAAQSVALDAPDDALLAAVLAKLFDDRQVRPRPDVIPYLVDHMERSFAAAADVVSDLDRIALTEKRAVSRQLAIRALSHRSATDA